MTRLHLLELDPRVVPSTLAVDPPFDPFTTPGIVQINAPEDEAAKTLEVQTAPAAAIPAGKTIVVGVVVWRDGNLPAVFTVSVNGGQQGVALRLLFTGAFVANGVQTFSPDPLDSRFDVIATGVRGVGFAVLDGGGLVNPEQYLPTAGWFDVIPPE